MSVSWTDEYDPNELAKRIEQSKRIDPEGRMSFEGFSHAEYVAVLYSMLEFSTPFPEAEKRGIIWQAVSKAAKKGSVTPKSLLSEISKLEQSYMKRPPDRYVLVTSVSARSRVPFRRVRINGATVTFGVRLAKQYRGTRTRVEEDSRHSMPGEIPGDYSFVRVHLSARSPHEAAERALNTIDLVRGIWNWFFNRRHPWRISAGRRLPVNEILPGPLHTLHFPNGKLATESWWYETKRLGNERTHDVTNELDKMYKFLGNVRKRLAKCSYRQIIEDAIILYGRALDEWDWDGAFLKLWSVLEKLTETEGSYKVTIRRASFIAEDRNYHQQVLRHLRDYRNRYVHEAADSSEAETYMYQLKNFVEALLGFHLGSTFGFRSMKDVAEFLDLPSDKALLASRIRMMQYAQRFLKHV